MLLHPRQDVVEAVIVFLESFSQHGKPLVHCLDAGLGQPAGTPGSIHATPSRRQTALPVLRVSDLGPHQDLHVGLRVAEVAEYQGADREHRLVEGAKKEKELTLYSSIPRGSRG